MVVSSYDAVSNSTEFKNNNKSVKFFNTKEFNQICYKMQNNKLSTK